MDRFRSAEFPKTFSARGRDALADVDLRDLVPVGGSEDTSSREFGGF
jgi:hypothetical protein